MSEFTDPLAPYYLKWHLNCLDSIKWLAGTKTKYGWQEIEWLVDYYEQKATIYWCNHQSTL